MILIDLTNGELDSLDLPEKGEELQVFHDDLLREDRIERLCNTVIQVEGVPAILRWFWCTFTDMQPVNKLWLQVLNIRTLNGRVDNLREHRYAHLRCWQRKSRRDVLHELLLEVAVTQKKESLDRIKMRLEVEFLEHDVDELGGGYRCGLGDPVSYVVVLVDGS